MSKDTNGLNSKQSEKKTDASVNLGRHKAQCSICRHPRCNEIEEAFVDWQYPVWIAREIGVSRDSIYRHARAVNLFAKRQANLKMIPEKALERLDGTELTGSNLISMFKIYWQINLDEKKAEAERPSDAETLQPDTTQQLDAPMPDGSLANLAEETESAISKDPHGDRDSVKLINAEKAAEAAQLADEKPAGQETTAKERGNSVLVGIIDKVIGETPGAESGQRQDEQKEPPGPEHPTLQKAAEATHSADEKPATQETMAKERGNGVLAGIIDKVIGETPGAEPGQDQDEEKEPQYPEPTTTTVQ